MTIRPDVLAPGLDIVFCGTAVGNVSARRGAYYAGLANAPRRQIDVAPQHAVNS